MMVMMSMVMVMMVSIGGLLMMNVTIFFATIFTLIFKFECYMTNSMLFQFFANFMFNFVVLTRANNVHCSIVALSIH